MPHHQQQLPSASSSPLEGACFSCSFSVPSSSFFLVAIVCLLACSPFVVHVFLPVWCGGLVEKEKEINMSRKQRQGHRGTRLVSSGPPATSGLQWLGVRQHTSFDQVNISRDPSMVCVCMSSPSSSSSSSPVPVYTFASPLMYSHVCPVFPFLPPIPQKANHSLLLLSPSPPSLPLPPPPQKAMLGLLFLTDPYVFCGGADKNRIA